MRALLIYPTCQTLYPHIGFNCQFYGGVYIYSASRMINTADADAASPPRGQEKEPKHGFAAHRQSRRHHRIRPRHRYASALALAREGARIVITDIDPDSVRQAVAGFEGSRLRGHRHRAGRLRRRPGAGHGRRGSARLRRHRHPGQQRRLHPRQVPAQDAGSGLGRRGRHHPERRLPLHPGGPALHDGKKVGPRDQHRLARALGQPRPDQLLCRQGRPDRLHPRAGAGTGQVQHHRQRHRRA